MKANGWRTIFPTVICIFTTLFYGARLYLLVLEKSVNVLFWDQWDFYTPLFEQLNVWEIFSWQHGPHRQGLGNLLIKILAFITGWNTRANSFAIFAIILVSASIAIFLKYRLFGKVNLSDVVIPVIVLTITQYETLVGTPNESLSALPLLLTLFYCFCWLIPNSIHRYSSISLINFFMVFTGFGLLIAPITILLLVIDIFRCSKNRSDHCLVPATLALLVALGTNGLFLIGYRFLTAVDCFMITPSFILQYPRFAGLMFMKFIGVEYKQSEILPDGMGIVVLILLTGILFYHLWSLSKGDSRSKPISLVITILLGYSLLFSLATAMGRICLGLDIAQSSRYMTLIIPGFLGLYFHILTLSKAIYRQTLMLLLAVILIFGSWTITSKDQRIIDSYSIEKESWKECYLVHEDIQYCNDLTGYKIYPGDDERIKERLDYLKLNHLNLFLDLDGTQ